MKKTLSNIKNAAIELWRDDRGAEGLEKVLIIAAVALPLLAVLLFFSGEIREWVKDNWTEVQGNSNTNNNPSNNPF